MRNVSGLNRDKVMRLLGILDEALAELVNIRRLEKAGVLSSQDRFALEDLFYNLFCNMRLFLLCSASISC